MNPFNSWTTKEILSFKDCIRLTGWNPDLASLAVRTRSIHEIYGVLNFLQNSIATWLKVQNLSLHSNQNELQFILKCAWDLTIGREIPLNVLFPVHLPDISSQLRQLLVRYREDQKNILNNTTQIPKTINIQLIPKNHSTEFSMSQFGYKCKLQLSMGKNKKMGSIIDHLYKKWKAATSDKIIRLHSSCGKSWGKEDKNLTVTKLYSLLKCTGGLIRLEYTFTSLTKENESINALSDISFTPSFESKFIQFLDANPVSKSKDNLNDVPTKETVSPNFYCIPSEEDDSPDIDIVSPEIISSNIISPIFIDNNQMPLPNIIKEDIDSSPEEYIFPPNDLPNPIEIPDRPSASEIDESLPITPFKSSGSLEPASRDGFSPMSRKYEGKCRDYWYKFEESIDYCSFYTGKRKRDPKMKHNGEPVSKKRLINA